MQNPDIYSALDFPVFQNRMFGTAEAARACAKGDVVLTQDPLSGLIFNRRFQPELMQYDADYQNEQANSGVFQTHLRQVMEIVRRNFEGQTLVEVGCGKGHFLELLQRDGFKITGFDPTYEGNNPQIVKRYFSSAAGVSSGALILRHVLEHVQNPLAFLADIAKANGGKGKIYIEVPCFDWICEQRAWFDVFYEHVNYFRLADFERMFETIVEKGKLFGNQYLYVVADLGSLREPTDRIVPALHFPDDFLYGVARHADRLRSKKPDSFAVWGGASKGVIFSLLMERAGVDLDIVIDINPGKHNKFLPGTGLMVRSPEVGLTKLRPHADILVMNNNYLDEIRRATGNRFNYVTVDHEII